MRAIARAGFFPLPRIRVLPVLAALLSLLLPAVAAAEWGNENWGVMVWGGSPLASIPSVPVAGLAALAGLMLVISYWLLAARRWREESLAPLLTNRPESITRRPSCPIEKSSSCEKKSRR